MSVYDPRHHYRLTLRPQLAPRLIFALLLLALFTQTLIATATPSRAAALPPAPPPTTLRATTGVTLDNFVFLPLIQTSPPPYTCQGIPSEIYGTLSVNPPPTDRPAAQHADLNLGLRGYSPTSAALTLININGAGDGNAPQFPGFFHDNRTPTFTSADRVNNWSWSCNCATTPISSPPVTLLGMGTTVGETIAVPSSGYDIGGGYEVLVPLRRSRRASRSSTHATIT